MRPIACLLLAAGFALPLEGAGEAHASPVALVTAGAGQPVYVACSGTREIAVVDSGSHRITQRFPVPARPTGLALSPDGHRLYVTCMGQEGSVEILEARTGNVVGSVGAGHTPMSPVLSADGRRLYFCNRFDGTVSAVDLAGPTLVFEKRTGREPIAAVLTPDGRRLWVASHLPDGPANGRSAAAEVTILDGGTGASLGAISLPSGASSVREIRLSPGGSLAGIPHILGRINLPTTQVERGWMNTNALSLIDVPNQRLINTVLLDDLDRGAAGPWSVDWTADGQRLGVTHSGTHELSVIDAGALVAKLGEHAAAEVPSDLTFLVKMRRRVPLKGRGPRALAIAGQLAYVANYYSGSLDVVDLNRGEVVETISLDTAAAVSETRRGEMLFHDATLGFQGWQACASCHPDARSDALHWDLLNDGLGNPKNTRSLLLSHRTPPAMSGGIRETAEMAV
ncbi:MAG: cell surface protein, partial [bacterium]|nr:cell surface protein [bacterium]